MTENHFTSAFESIKQYHGKDIKKQRLANYLLQINYYLDTTSKNVSFIFKSTINI